jgi:outer membrane autotransporter protein
MSVTGAVTNQGGADIVIASTGVLSAGGGLTNTGAGSTVTLNGGQIAGNVTNAAGATLDAAAVGSSITGTLTNSASVNVFAGQNLSVGGLTTNQSGGNITVGSGAAYSGSITNQSGGVVDFLGGGGGYIGTFTNNAGGTVSFTGANGFIGSMSNAGLIEMVAGSSFGGLGSITNTGTIDMGAGSSFTSFVSNAAGGTVLVNGTASFTAGLNSAGTLDLANGATGDVLNISGGAVLNGTAQMDVDLSDGSTASDRIVISGTSSGSLTVDFSIVGTPGTAGAPIIIVDYDEVAGSSLSVTGTNLPAGGGTAYFLSNNAAAGYWEIVTGVNPAVGGIASSATLIQSLIGSVVNRPSSPYVAGLAAAEENPCGVGAWGRAVAGVADASGSVESETTSGGNTTFSNQITANYYGIQLGGDFSCFEGFYNGWDLGFGGFVGLNTGKAELPAFLVDPNSGAVLTGSQTDLITTDFNQTYVGLYAAASRGRFFADLQYRLERSDYDISSEVFIPSLSVGISDQSVSSEAQTLSGSVSYVFPINQDLGVVLVPTAGFSWTKTDAVDTIAFDDGGTLDIQPNENRVAFIGATIARSVIRPDGQTALNYFATATAYKDFADPAESLYLPAGAAPGSELRTLSSNLETYGELSVGVNYTRLLDPGQLLNARQLNASIRLDGRFSDTLDSWGVTGQVRLQF